jgi:hypothetical protein
MSVKYVRRRILLPSGVNLISPVASFSASVSLDQRHPLLGGWIMCPWGPLIVYVKLGLGLGEFNGFPSNQAPRGSLSGFEKCVRFDWSANFLGCHPASFP